MLPDAGIPAQKRMLNSSCGDECWRQCRNKNQFMISTRTPDSFYNFLIFALKGLVVTHGVLSTSKQLPSGFLHFKTCNVCFTNQHLITLLKCVQFSLNI